MRTAFVAGATGFIGAAVCAELLKRGWDVKGLARTDEKAAALKKAGVEPVRGDLRDPASSWDADLVVHAAAEYSAEYRPLDRNAAEWLAGRASAGCVAIYTSGVWLYGSDSATVNETTALPDSHIAWRAGHEKLVLEQGGIVLRPGCVYGGSGSLTAEWFAKRAPISGEGKNRWATVELTDLAEAYALAAESKLRGGLFNVTDGSSDHYADMADAASKAAGGEGVERLGPDAAARRWGAMAQALAFDQAVDSSKAKRELGWSPRHRGFLSDPARWHREFEEAR